MIDCNPRERAHELVATHASDHVVRTQAGSKRVGHRDEEGVAGGMTLGVVRGLEPVDVDVGRNELPAVALGAIDLPPDGGEPRAAAAYPGQLVGPRILTVLRRLCAILGRNLAVLDGPHAAVGGLCAP